MTYLDHLECSECHERLPVDVPQPNECRDGGLLFARYDLDRARKELSKEDAARGPASLWRYGPLLPVADVDRGGDPGRRLDAAPPHGPARRKRSAAASSG